MIQQIQAITYDAYKSSGQAAALLKDQGGPPEAMAKVLERTAAQMEQGTVELRALCESCLPELLTIGWKPALPTLDVAGSISVNEFGWLMIELNTLLPHCRFSTPVWLTDTISRLLNRHERRHGKLPMLDRALTFGYVGGTNHHPTFGYKYPSKPLTIGYIDGAKTVQIPG